MVTLKVRRLLGLSLSLWLFLVTAPVSAENEALRYLQSLALAPLNELQPGKHTVEHAAGAPYYHSVSRVHIYRRPEALYVALIPSNAANYTLTNSGSYIVRRSHKGGAITQIKIVAQSSPLIALRLTPASPRGGSLLQVSFGSRTLYQRVPLSIPIESLVATPLLEIIAATSALVDWDTLLNPPDPHLYTPLGRVLAVIRRHLPHLPDSDDGAMDEYGNMVFIATGTIQNGKGGFNCSGFAKWIADGLYYPLTGRYLALAPLKERGINRASPWGRRYDTTRDPYFGLDWSRNIAKALWSARYRTAGVEWETTNTSVDVRHTPYDTYIPDVGYSVQHLETILYYLALESPNSIYVGSVNRQFGEAPQIRHHLHLAVFIPHFDSDGNFRVAVMERNFEDSLQSFVARNGSDFIHLVRLPPVEQFTPPDVQS